MLKRGLPKQSVIHAMNRDKDFKEGKIMRSSYLFEIFHYVEERIT